MQRVLDVLSIAWSALVLVIGVLMLLGLVLVGVLFLLPFLVFLTALL